MWQYALHCDWTGPGRDIMRIQMFRMVLNLLGVLAVALSNFIMVAEGMEAERIDSTPSQVITGVLLSLLSQFVGARPLEIRSQAVHWELNALLLNCPSVTPLRSSCFGARSCGILVLLKIPGCAPFLLWALKNDTRHLCSCRPAGARGGPPQRRAHAPVRAAGLGGRLRHPLHGGRPARSARAARYSGSWASACARATHYDQRQQLPMLQQATAGYGWAVGINFAAMVAVSGNNLETTIQ